MMEMMTVQSGHRKSNQDFWPGVVPGGALGGADPIERFPDAAGACERRRGQEQHAIPALSVWIRTRHGTRRFEIGSDA